jgi:hypothetical protein
VYSKVLRSEGVKIVTAMYEYTKWSKKVPITSPNRIILLSSLFNVYDEDLNCTRNTVRNWMLIVTILSTRKTWKRGIFQTSRLCLKQLTRTKSMAKIYTPYMKFQINISQLPIRIHTNLPACSGCLFSCFFNSNPLRPWNNPTPFPNLQNDLKVS